jgi:hypothetical protein
MYKKLVDKDVFFKNKSQKTTDECCVPGLEACPVDMNGQPAPYGISAADKARNIKQVEEGILARF